MNEIQFRYQVYRKSTKEYAYCGFSILEAAELDLQIMMNRYKEPKENFEIHIIAISESLAGVIE